jgi:hypothetical protein
MADERHPLDRAYAELREATLRRAAAREAGDERTEPRIIIEHKPPPSIRPTAKRTTITAAIAGVLWGLWELYNLIRR